METENKTHYESLLIYFKYLVTITGGAITLMTGAAIYYSYHSLKDLRDDIKKEAEEIKSKALNSIENTKNQATIEINGLKYDAKELAIKSTQIEVNKAFETNKIRNLIEKTAENKLSSKLGIIVKQETSKIEDIFRSIPILTTTYEQARWNGQVRKYIDTLYYYSLNASHELTRLLAKEFLLQKGRDYENFFIETNMISSQDSILIICERSLELTASKNNLKKLYNTALTEENLEKLTQAFICIRKVTNANLPNFDFEQLQKLMKANYD
ncbi:MAG: hypothetical protein IPQ02_04020 [Saprospiraceae bacterium]|uniref:Uncharacterized protein n=1 Tax=Candidatus Defluviibacterium haderslevense TaxID=2981993 RepID=A0A9D7SBX0_9BACT|nr:hypothetical protein [Candidatus Defluviibacterium haderslevense]MBL0235788.1 hypothetical protein [Candidatus Defluviibacterium haderslevense]